MARIAFCRELGRGCGHIVPHLDLLRRLVARGDEVVFLAQDPERVQSVFRHENFSVRPLAHGYTPIANRMRDADSFPQVLFNSGFHDTEALHARLVDVVVTLESTAPDVIVCDYAPSVMLANHTARRPLVLAGNGFWSPPRSTPMPRFRYWLGAPPQWPNDDGPKVFAYLAPGPTVSATLAALAAQRASVCLYAPNLTATGERELPPEIFHRAAGPISLSAAGAACQAIVNNGNLTTAAGALLAGKPQLCLPGTAEQYMNARRIELLGAGLAAPRRRPDDINAKLHALLYEPGYARAAARVAHKYAGARLSDRTDRMLAELDELL